MRTLAIRVFLGILIVLPALAGFRSQAHASVPLEVDVSDGYTFSGVQKSTASGAEEFFIESPFGPFTVSGNRTFVQLSGVRGESSTFLNCSPDQAVTYTSETINNLQTNHYSVDLAPTGDQFTSIEVGVPQVENTGVGVTTEFPLEALNVVATFVNDAGTPISIPLDLTSPSPGEDARFLGSFSPPVNVNTDFTFDLTFTAEVPPQLEGNPDVASLNCPPPNENLEESTDFGRSQIILRDQYVVINVDETASNSAPVLNPTGLSDREMQEGQEGAFGLTASDPDGDVISWTAQGLPAGCQLTVLNPNGTAAAIICDTSVQAGTHTVTVTVTDPFGSSNAGTFTITIRPFLDTGGDQAVVQGEQIVLTPIASPGATIEFDLDGNGKFETPGPVATFDATGLDTGDYNVGIRATKNGVTMVDDVVVTVVAPNLPPVFELTGSTSAIEGQMISVALRITDPENGPLSFVRFDAVSEDHPCVFSVTGLTDGSVEIDLVCDTQVGDAGQYVFTAFASDGVKTASTTVVINILEAGNTPVIVEIDDVVMNEGESTTVPVVANDPDGDDISLVVSGLPSFGTFIDNGNGTGAFTFAPTFVDEGDYIVTVRATEVNDPASSTEEIFLISVNNVNRNPNLDPIDDFNIDEGDVTTLTVTGGDVDGDSLVISADVPSFVSLVDNGDGSGVITVNPGFDASGIYSATITITDNGTPSLTDSDTFTITVDNVNRNPNIDPIDDVFMNEGETETITITSGDVDGDGVVTIADLPPFASFVDNGDGTGLISLSPDFDDAGNYSGSVSITDDGFPNLSDTETFTITVTNVNRNPNLDPIDDVSITEGDSTTITITGSDLDGDGLTLNANLPAFASLVDNGNGTGVITISTNIGDAGSYPASITLSDDGDPVLDDEDTFTLTVTEIERPGEESYDELESLIRAVVDNMVVEGVLLSMVNLAQYFDEIGLEGVAVRLLRTFIRVVDNLPPFLIDQLDAQQLIDFAESLLENLID